MDRQIDNGLDRQMDDGRMTKQIKRLTNET